jgi:hypothetical protein
MLTTVCWLVTPCSQSSGFQRHRERITSTGTFIMSIISSLKIEAIHSSETLVTTYKSAPRRNPADDDRQAVTCSQRHAVSLRSRWSSCDWVNCNVCCLQSSGTTKSVTCHCKRGWGCHQDDSWVTLLMDAVSTSETSVSCYETARSNIPDGCHPRRRENLSSCLKCCVFQVSVNILRGMFLRWRFICTRPIPST